MLKKLTMAAAALAMATPAFMPIEAAQAQSWRGDRGDYYGRDYRRSYRGDRQYRNHNRNYYRGQRCENGDGGTVIGAIAGGLLGNQVAGRGDKAIGTILGGAVGAVAGRAIDRSDRPNYCRR